jgi:hypothetical protein
MKNKLLLTLVLSIVWLASQAQGETRIGIKAGFTSANVYGPDVAQLSNNGNTSPLGGFHFGLFIHSQVGKHLWIKSEVLYIQKGTVLFVKDKWGQQYKGNFKSQYIDVYPVSLTFHYKGFQVLAGPYVGLLINSTVQQKDSLGTSHNNSSIFGYQSSLSVYRQKLDAGLVVGLEYEFKWGITIGGRYTRGFVPLFENAATLVTNPTGSPLPSQKIYNENLSVSLGYVLGQHQKEKKPAAK